MSYFSNIPKPILDVMRMKHVSEEERIFLLRVGKRASLSPDGCVYYHRLDGTIYEYRPLIKFRNRTDTIARIIFGIAKNVQTGRDGRYRHGHTRQICGNQGCINPSHLMCGHAADNMQTNKTVTELMKEEGLI